MNVPFFHIEEYVDGQKIVTLDEDNSRHVVQVLRMRAGDRLNLTDGKGHLLTCAIADDHKKHCSVTVLSATFQEKRNRKVSIAISLLKNASRFEWFLEKATEIGVDNIIPIICERTEKEKFRFERLKGICISALLQSQQVRMPILSKPVHFSEWILDERAPGQKFIAHCLPGTKNELAAQSFIAANAEICIGPEGDFTLAEIDQAIQREFVPVSLGETRLRTETAGVVAVTLLRLARE